MDKIDKALKRLNLKEKYQLKEVLLKVRSGGIKSLDVQKLKDRQDIFRVRKGNMRVIFRKIGKEIKILALERRTSKTYRKR